MSSVSRDGEPFYLGVDWDAQVRGLAEEVTHDHLFARPVLEEQPDVVYGGGGSPACGSDAATVMKPTSRSRSETLGGRGPPPASRSAKDEAPRPLVSHASRTRRGFAPDHRSRLVTTANRDSVWPVTRSGQALRQCAEKAGRKPVDVGPASGLQSWAKPLTGAARAV